MAHIWVVRRQTVNVWASHSEISEYFICKEGWRKLILGCQVCLRRYQQSMAYLLQNIHISRQP